MEDKLATDAASYASPERQLQEAGKAEAGVTQQFDVQRDAAQRNLESFGIDPSSTRFAALDRGAGMAQAAATAGAGNQAIDQTVQRGMALRSEAINVGRGYPGQIAQQYSTAGQGGSGAINTGLQTTASGANTMGTTPQYQALGNSALSGWGNTLNTGYQNQLAQFNANQNASSGWGSALGLAGGIAASFIKVGEGGAIPVSPQDTVPQNVVPQEASPTSGKAIDDVPARLTVGEFVLPKDVVAWEGEKSLQGLITKAREASAKAKQQVQGQPVMGRGIPQAPTYISPSAH